MSEKLNVPKPLMSRLKPLYAAAFFQGFVFWYAVEKLFMNSIGFDGAGIGVMVTLYSIIMLLTETPSGILADRWSRKGVLILASLSLAACSLIGGLSYTPASYFIAAGFWGVFFALYSGTYDSIVYDTILEETGKVDLFDKLYGRVKMVDSFALVSGSLVSGLLAQTTNLRVPYFATVPVSLLAIVALIKFKEPKLHKSHLDVAIKEHLSLTFTAIGRNRSLLPIMASLVCMSTVMYMLFEFSQLWYLALAAPVVFFGPANAAMLTSTGLGGAVASYFGLSKQIVMKVSLSAGAISCLGLVFVRNIYIAIFLQLVVATIIIAILVIFNRLLHNSLTSNVRAGAASAVNTLSRIIIVPLALVFGQLTKVYSVFQAGWILVAFFIAGTFFILLVSRRDNNTGLEA